MAFTCSSGDMPDSFALMSFHAPCPGNCRLATYPGFFRSFSRTEVHFGIFPILLLISSVPNSRMGPPSPRFPAGAACASGSRAGSAGVTAGGGSDGAATRAPSALFLFDRSEPTELRLRSISSSSSAANAPGYGNPTKILTASRPARTRSHLQRIIYLSRKAFCRAFKIGFKI